MEKIHIPLGLDKGQIRKWQKQKIWELSSSRIHSYAEIADALCIGQTFIYKLLRQIAEEKGVPYKSLLYQPHKEPSGYNRTAPYVCHPHDDNTTNGDVFDTMLANLRDLEANCVRILDTLKPLLPTKGE